MDHQRILEIEYQLAALPVGNLTYKQIKGKSQPYLQWSEHGKTKTQYIKVSQREEIFRQLKLRDELRAELERLRRQSESMERDYLSDSYHAVPGTYSVPMLREHSGGYHAARLYHANVITGDLLRTMTGSVKGFEKRDCYPVLKRYLDGEYWGKVCLLYGLRRTGKTTLLWQAIRDLSEEDFARAAYLKATPYLSMRELNQDLQTLLNGGYRFIFLDEITLVEDFIDSAALFSDVYAAMGMKIVLSGTDSLGFWFAQKGELYDRAITIHTTWIPFREFSRLLRQPDIDTYIRYGGTLKAGELAFEDADALMSDAAFRDDESTRRYIDTAICQNIQHSLNYCKDGLYFRHLQDLYEAGELTDAINRIIESMNHRFLLRTLTCRFKSHDLGSAAEVLRKQADPQRRTDLLDRVDRETVTECLKAILSIKEQEERQVGLTKAHVDEIKDYLSGLDLVVDCPMETYLTDAPPSEYTLFTQPGMRYCQAQALVHVLMKDPTFAEASERERALASDRILEEVRGRMLEDIVLLETMLSLPKGKRAFKLILSRSEFDMVIYDEKENTCQLYEIKHSKQVVSNQYHALADPDACALAQRKYGSITGRYVLYRGEDRKLPEGISYRNVESYLRGL